MPAGPQRWRRRAFVLGAASLAAAAGQAAQNWPTGWVKPRDAAPAIALTDAHGKAGLLAERLRGAAAAVQLIFTGCGTTCPTQGLLFSRLAARHKARPMRWLSISIDALGDDATRLLAWQDGLGRQPAWNAAVPAVKDVARLVSFLRGAPADAELHTTQVFAFDREGRLTYRTGDNPPLALLDQMVDAVL